MVSTILPLRVSGAVVKRRAKTLLGPLDLLISGAGITLILGPNGAGKTTLLRALHGLDRLREGRADWAVPVEEARARQAYVFQRPIMMRRSVRDNLIFPLRLRGLDKSECAARAAHWLALVGLSQAAHRPAPRLSGGEQQKLALARALITEPEVLFLDEPCAALDGAATREIEAVLRQARAAGTRIVMSTHDLGQARRLGEEIVFLHRGQLLEQGPAEAFFTRPQTAQAQAYLNGDIVE